MYGRTLRQRSRTRRGRGSRSRASLRHDGGHVIATGRVPCVTGASAVASVISPIGVMPAIAFLRKLAQLIRHRAKQPAVDVHRTAAHAGNDAGLGEWSALETREDEIAARSDDVLEHADDVDLELLDLVAFETRCGRCRPCLDGPRRQRMIGGLRTSGRPSRRSPTSATSAARLRRFIANGWKT